MQRNPMRDLLPRMLVALVLLWVVGCSREPTPEEPREAPDFSLSNIDGEPVHLDTYRGKVVLLDFWATWCPPCRVAIPHLVELQEKYRPDGFIVLGMNMDKNPEDLADFMSRQTINYPTLRVDDATKTAYGGVISIPQAFLIDRKGMIRKKYMGFTMETAKDMEQNIQVLLEEGGT